MAVYFIADTHFGDDAIRRYEDRPFPTAERMDEALIRGWNAAVREEDTVYVLGDLGAAGREAELLSRLKGTKYLVKGNHDTASNEYYRRAGFREVYDCPIILDDFWILSHEPLYVSRNMPYANLFGHIHGSPIYKDLSAQHYCVCAERLGYAPISFDAVKAAVRAAASAG